MTSAVFCLNGIELHAEPCGTSHAYDVWVDSVPKKLTNWTASMRNDHPMQYFAADAIVVITETS